MEEWKIHQQNRIKSSESDPHKYKQLVFDLKKNGAKISFSTDGTGTIGNSLQK
jgi:hypothetical protein